MTRSTSSGGVSCRRTRLLGCSLSGADDNMLTGRWIEAGWSNILDTRPLLRGEE